MKVKYVGPEKEVVNRYGNFKKGEETDVEDVIGGILANSEKEFEVVGGVKENKVVIKKEKGGEK